MWPYSLQTTVGWQQTQDTKLQIRLLSKDSTPRVHLEGITLLYTTFIKLMIIYTYTKTELVLVNIIFLKHNHSLHHSEVKDLNLCYLRRPSPWVAKGDACAERHVLAWGEGRGLCPPRCRDDPKCQNEMFPLGLYQINASHALLSTMRLSEACQNMTSWHGENISGGKGQVSVLTWLPWPGTWYLDSLQKMEDLVR